MTRQRTWRENRKLWVTFADDDDDLYWCVLDDGQIDRILDDYEKELNLREPNQDVEYQVSLHAFREIAGNQRWFAVGL